MYIKIKQVSFRNKYSKMLDLLQIYNRTDKSRERLFRIKPFNRPGLVRINKELPSQMRLRLSKGKINSLLNSSGLHLFSPWLDSLKCPRNY